MKTAPDTGTPILPEDSREEKLPQGCFGGDEELPPGGFRG